MMLWSHGREGFIFLALHYTKVAILPGVQSPQLLTTYLPLENSLVLPAMAVISIVWFVSATTDQPLGGLIIMIGKVAIMVP